MTAQMALLRISERMSMTLPEILVVGIIIKSFIRTKSMKPVMHTTTYTGIDTSATIDGIEIM